MVEDTGDSGSIDRRKFIEVLGVGGAAALAGCSSGDGGDGGDGGGGDGNGGDGGDGSGGGDGGGSDDTLVMFTATEGGGTHAAGAGLATLVNENSDGVRLDSRPSRGTALNAGALGRGECDIAFMQTYSLNQMLQDVPPYDELDYQPLQLFKIFLSNWIFVAPVDRGIDSFADIEPNHNVSPLHAEAGPTPMLADFVRLGAPEYNKVSVDVASQAGAFQQGQLDVGVAPILNKSIEPGYIQELKSTVDLRVLEVSDDVVQQAEDDPVISIGELDMTQFDGYAETPDTAIGGEMDYGFISRSEVSADLLYEMFTVMYENREGMGDYHALLGSLSDVEFWAEAGYNWETPFHAGAARFYKEQDVWDSEAFTEN